MTTNKSESMNEMGFADLMKCPKPELCEYIVSQLRSTPEKVEPVIAPPVEEPKPLFEAAPQHPANLVFKKKGRKKRNG